jgi:hypothetical protein
MSYVNSETSAGRALGRAPATASPVVTVVMPVRNEVAFTGRSLSSGLAQDYLMTAGRGDGKR